MTNYGPQITNHEQCRTCSCGNVQTFSEANSDRAVRCSQCGRTFSVSNSDDQPTPRVNDLAEETRLLDSDSVSLNEAASARKDDDKPAIVTPSSTESDDFDLTPNAVTKVLDPSERTDGAVDLATKVIAPMSEKQSASAVRRGSSGGAHVSDMDLKQPVMATIKRSHVQAATAQPGNEYGCHRVLRVYQKGGMGRIMLAYDQFLKRDVALKELHPEVMDDPSIVQRFIGEAEVTAQLEHPGIVPIHALGQNEGSPYYTMMLIRGQTLQDAIKAYHRNPNKGELARLVRKLASVCKTMSYAHNKGYIHRDLKPANIMLGEHGETLVMDWGLAKSFLIAGVETFAFRSDSASNITQEARPELTMVGAVVGTLAFMSPEQATPELGTVGPLSDVFSLGAVLYYLLTGQTAFSGRSTQDILNKVRNSTPIKPSQIRPYVPFDLEMVCLKAMERNPDNRYQSADELFDDLCRWLDNHPVHARKETPVQRTWRQIRKNRQVSLSVPMILLLLVLAAAGTLTVYEYARLSRGVTVPAVLLHDVDILDQPCVGIEGDDGLSLHKEMTGAMPLRVTVQREGMSFLTVTAPTGFTWDLTVQHSLTLSLLEHQSGRAVPLKNLFVRMGQGSAYFEFRPTEEWWEKRVRGNWSAFSIPLDGSAHWTKREVNDPSPNKIQWIELHVEADKPTAFWIDNMMFVN